MRRIVMVLITTVLILVAVFFLITQGGVLASVTQRGKDVISLIQALLQMVAVALGLALVVFILIQYALYIRPPRFIFQGFSNAPKLVEAEKLPLDLDMLAQEELVYRFKVLYSQWEKYSGDRKPDTSKRTSMLAQLISWKKYSGDRKPDTDTLLPDELLFENASSSQDIKKFLSIELTKDNRLLDDLKEIIQHLKDSEDINLMNLAGELAPKEVTPIMKFIEAIFPPHTIKATGHLQWSTEKAGRAGVTFEFVDLGSRRNLMVRTLWRSLKKRPVSTDGQPLSGPGTNDNVSVDGAQSNQKQPALTDDDKISFAAVLFIELLKPTMHWLALMFWEQRMISNVPYKNYILRKHEKRRKAQILYVLGAMYYASANQFPDYDDFFCQLAVEHFRKASTIDPGWCLPDLYLANLYSFKMQEAQENSVQRQKLQKEAQHLYDDALKRVENGNDKHALQKVLVAKAWAELISGDDDQANIACTEVVRLEQLEPAKFDPQRSDCGSYLFNLAVCYIQAPYTNANFINALEKARRTLAYCLVRDWELKDMINQNPKIPSNIVSFLKLLEPVLEKKLDKFSQLNTLTGKSFDDAIGLILKEVKQLESQNELQSRGGWER